MHRMCKYVYNIYKQNILTYIFLCIYTFSYIIFLPLGDNITSQCHHTHLFFVSLGAQQCQCCEGPLGCGRGAVWAGKLCCFPEKVMLHATSCSIASFSTTLCIPRSRLHVNTKEQKVSSTHGLRLGVRRAWKPFCGYKEPYPNSFPSGIRLLVFTLPWIVGMSMCIGRCLQQNSQDAINLWLLPPNLLL